MRRTIALLAAMSLVLTTLAVAPAAASHDDCDVRNNQNIAQSFGNVNIAKIFQRNVNVGTVGGAVVVSQTNVAEVKQGTAEAESEADC